ncbi:MAG: hypothetical protein JST87_13265 [Bacteroidetes bacterium]|nr:hypothetical protein [Bacteroidota bacterium]
MPVKSQNTPIDVKKLLQLRNILSDAIKKCDEIISLISNDTIRKTLLSLEQLNYQYVRELNAQIEILGGKPLEVIFNDNKELAFLINVSKKAKGEVEKKAVGLCTKIERSAVVLYNKMLKSSIGNDNLRKMIRYQRNGIMCANQQLKLLTQFIHR